VIVGLGPSVDATTPVTELTPAERDAWCRWYLEVPPGAPDPVNQPVDGNGYVPSAGYGGTKFYDAVCLPIVSVAQCVSNLALGSCELPVSELTDCVSTVMVADLPAPHGGGQYVSTPGCLGTIVSTAPTGCTIRVQ
jgi:hypothetical protein